MIELFCSKMPISCLLRGLLERCFSAERLDALFEKHAQEQYMRNLLFSTTSSLLLYVVLRIYPSAHAAHQARKKDMNVSAAALYDKLKGIEVNVSAAMVRETAQDLSQILDELGVKQESWLPGFTIRILDGNCLEASEKRLRVHRGVRSATLPGKSLAVLDPERRLIIDVFPCEDGHAQERSLLSAVAPIAQPKDVWICDRNFCVLSYLQALHERQAFALMRLHSNLPLTKQTPLRFVAETDEGQRLFEQHILINGHTYRRIRVELKEPTRDGDLYIDLITDLPDTISALTVAHLYRKRWTLETAFQHIEKHFESEINTLAYPRAALFGFCLALMAYNIFSVMLAAMDCAHQKPVSENISSYYIANEISATFLALLKVSEAQDWRFLATCSSAQFAQWLCNVARNIELDTLKKHTRGPKKSQKKAPYDPKHPHVSTYRLLQGA